jgi:serine/threonine-protein kinase
MQKDPARRYRTVDSLIRDIDHYLRGEPLEARPDTAGYRMRKFLRRHWRAVSVAAAVLLVMLSLVGFYTARVTRAKNVAVREAERTRRIQEFMNNLFEGGDEAAGPADSLRVVTLLARGVQEAQSLSSEPAIQSELFQTLGSIYQNLGEFERADTLLSAALVERTARLGPNHPDVARSLVALGLLRADQSKLDEAEKLIREALEIGNRPSNVDLAAKARATTALGLVLENRGTYGRAIEVLTEAARLDSLGRLPAGDRSVTLTELANCQFYAGNYAVSDSLNRVALALDRKLFGERHPHVASDLINLGAIQQEQGHYPESEKFYREALDIYRGWYGENHYETAASLTMLARTLIYENRLAEAEGMLRQALAIRMRVYGPSHQSVASTLNELGRVAQQQGRLDDAEAHYRRMIEIYKAIYNDKHYLIGVALSNLGGVYTDRKRYGEAEELFREALRRYGETLPADHVYVGIAQIRMGRALLLQGRYADAERATLAGYKIVEAQSDPAVPWLQNARKDLIAEYEGLKQPVEAAKYRIALDGVAPVAPSSR